MTMLMDNDMIKPMERSNQQGFVAIFSVLIIMGILTLLAIGFSSITRQAQRRTLDDQLNTQAFYAAESGVNQVYANRESLADKESCVNESDGYDYEVGDPGLGATISCLLIDTDPTSLEFGTVPLVGDNPLVAYVGSTEDISRLRFYWDSTEASAPISRFSATESYTEVQNAGPSYMYVFDSTTGNPRFRPVTEWGNAIGVVRVDLVPANDLARAQTAGNGYTFFLYPGSRSGTTEPGESISTGPATPVSPGTSGKGEVVGRQCSLPQDGGYRCAANIDLSAPGAAFYMRLQSYYSATKVRVEGQSTDDTRVNFIGGQALVDSTGRVADVSRRIQVRLPLFEPSGYHESFSILSASSICKRLVVMSGAASASTSGLFTTEDDPTAASICNPAND